MIKLSILLLCSAVIISIIVDNRTMHTDIVNNNNSTINLILTSYINHMSQQTIYNYNETNIKYGFMVENHNCFIEKEKCLKLDTS